MMIFEQILHFLQKHYGWIEGLTDRPMDGPTYPLIEMQWSHLKTAFEVAKVVFYPSATPAETTPSLNFDNFSIADSFEPCYLKEMR